jgi:hypothetical protein
MIQLQMALLERKMLLKVKTRSITPRKTMILSLIKIIAWQNRNGRSVFQGWREFHLRHSLPVIPLRLAERIVVFWPLVGLVVAAVDIEP